MAVLGLAVVAAFLWGPLHSSYERACDVYPALRGVGPLPLALVTVALLASTTLGTGTFVAGGIRSLALSNRIRSKRIPTPLKLREAISDLSLEGRVNCIEEPLHQAFCYGLIRPTVCLSVPIVERLEPDELRAVLAHEREHLLARDPLRLLCGRALARALFLVPLAEEIYGKFLLRRELQADASCVATGYRATLASAMFKLLTAGTETPTGVAGFNVTEERISHLVEPGLAANLGIPWKRLFAQTMLRVGVLLTGIGASGWFIEAAVVGCLL